MSRLSDKDVVEELSGRELPDPAATISGGSDIAERRTCTHTRTFIAQHCHNVVTGNHHLVSQARPGPFSALGMVVGRIENICRISLWARQPGMMDALPWNFFSLLGTSVSLLNGIV